MFTICPKCWHCTDFWYGNNLFLTMKQKEKKSCGCRAQSYRSKGCQPTWAQRQREHTAGTARARHRVQTAHEIAFTAYALRHRYLSHALASWLAVLRASQNVQFLIFFPAGVEIWSGRVALPCKYQVPNAVMRKSRHRLAR